MTGSQPAQEIRWPSEPDGWRPDGEQPDDAFPVPFAISDGFGLVFLSFFVGIAVSVVAVGSGILEADMPGTVTTVLVVIAVELFTIAGVLGVLAIRRGLSWHLLGPVRPRLGHLGLGVAVGVGGFAVVTILLAVISAFVGEVPEPDQALMETSTQGGLVTALSLVVAMVLAPVAEEIIYRGVLFQSLRQRLGLWPAITISSAVFSAAHIELWSAPITLIGLFVLGSWLAWTFHRVGSLLVAIAGHSVFNGVAVAIAFGLA